MNKKLTTEEFIQKAQEIHGYKYDYSKVIYKNAMTNVIITCSQHGDFLQMPNKHLSQKHGCPKCGRSQKLTTEEFIQKAQEIHGNKYDYLKVNYINMFTKVIIICQKHGEFLQMPLNHLNSRGCLFCSNNVKFTTKEFIQKAQKIHGDVYDYRQVKYINNYIKIIIVCKKHGEFLQSPNNHISKKCGCPKCKRTVSNPEQHWLSSLNIPNDYIHRQVSLKVNNQRFNVDGYMPETNTIYEFLGDYYHGNPGIFLSEKYNPTCHKTFGELYQRTINKIKTLEAAGYTVIYIWETDFNKQLEVSL